MQVKDLTRESVWVPNRGHDLAARPAVSVLLATDRHVSADVLGRAVESILTQKVADLELIVVDDALAGNSAAIVREAMAADPRVHCIRRPMPVALEALSAYEAFVRSRGRYVVFASADAAFDPNGLAKLLAQAEAGASDIIHGYLRAHPATGTPPLPGRRNDHGHYLESLARGSSEAATIGTACVWKLMAWDLIPESAVLLRRGVLEEVGLPDPHVVLADSAGWDLLRRVIERFPVDYLDVCVATELCPRTGPASDRGPTARRAAALADLPREAALRPDAVPERDLTALPEGVDGRLVAFADDALTGLRSRGRLHALPPPEGGRKKILVLFNEGPSLQILTHGLPDDLRPAFHFYYGPFDRESLLPEALNASAVLVNRSLDVVVRTGLAEDLEAAGVPLIWYLDDNFFVLADEDPGFAWYRPDSFRLHRPAVAAAVCPTVPMAECLRDDAGIPDSVFWPPIAHPALAAGARVAPPADEFRLAVPGGLFRHNGVFSRLAEARSRLGVPMRVFSRQGGEPVRSEGLTVTEMPFAMSWAQFVLHWRRTRAHVLYHPPGDSSPAVRAHLAYKNNNAIMVSWLLGAVPLLADEPAYASVGEAEGVLKLATTDVGELERALRRLADPAFRADCFGRLEAFCRREYDPARAVPAVHDLLARCPEVNAHVADLRWARLVGGLGATLRRERAAAGHDVQSLQATVRDLEARCRQQAVDRDREVNSVRFLAWQLLRRTAGRVARLPLLRSAVAPVRRLIGSLRR
jgi:hypothetical protein